MIVPPAATGSLTRPERAAWGDDEAVRALVDRSAVSVDESEVDSPQAEAAMINAKHARLFVTRCFACR
jgi:hypothetical protein